MEEGLVSRAGGRRQGKGGQLGEPRERLRRVMQEEGAGAETTSVSKSSVKTHESDIQLPMSVGRIAGAGIESETRTVAATATISSNPVRNSSDRNTEIASFTLKF